MGKKIKKEKSNKDEEVSKILILIQWCYNTGRKPRSVFPSVEKANTETKVPGHILNFFARIIITFRIDDRVRRVSGWDARPLLVSRSSWGRTFLRFLSRFGNFVLPFPKKNPVRTISRARSFVAMFFHRRHGSVFASLRFVPLLFPFSLRPFSVFFSSRRRFLCEFRASNSLDHIFDVFHSFSPFAAFIIFFLSRATSAAGRGTRLFSARRRGFSNRRKSNHSKRKRGQTYNTREIPGCTGCPERPSIPPRLRAIPRVERWSRNISRISLSDDLSAWHEALNRISNCISRLPNYILRTGGKTKISEENDQKYKSLSGYCESLITWYPVKSRGISYYSGGWQWTEGKAYEKRETSPPVIAKEKRVESPTEETVGSNKILRPRNRPIIVTARFDRVKHVVNVERDDPLADRNYF